MKKPLSWLLIAAELAATWAGALVLLPMLYAVARYRVESPPTMAMNYIVLLFPMMPLAAGAYLAYRRKGDSDWPWAVARAWLPLFLNALAALGAAVDARYSFLSPACFAVAIAASTALAIALLPLAVVSEGQGERARWPVACLLLLTCAAAAWMYAVQEHFVRQLAYGWPDSGLYYLRVKNTALGRGILQETLSKPPFYDHFDVALFILVPFYWLFKSYRIIMWAHAICLSAIGPAVFVYARGKGFSSRGAFLFAAAALLSPSTAQMSYAFSYGFHPIIMAIAPCILSLHFWEKGRLWPFAACAALAATTEQTVFAFYAGVGLVDIAFGRGGRLRGAVLAAVSLGLFFLVARVVQPFFTGPVPYYHLLKFDHLGGSFSDVLLSPFRKPGEFWGLLFSRTSVLYVTVLLCGMCLLPLCAPRQLLYPAIVLAFSLVMANPNLKIICYQYQSLVLAAWFPALIVGAKRLGEWLRARGFARPDAATAAAALCAAVVASHFYGLLPWSRMTLPFQRGKDDDFLADATGIRTFAESVRPPARVLATGRAAMLFCDAGDVTPLAAWNRKSTDYDLAVLQLYDDWGQAYDDYRLAYDTFAASEEFTLRPSGRFSVFMRRRGPSASQAQQGP